MKDIVGISKFSHGIRQSTGAKGSDVFLYELDTGGAQNGTLLMLLDTVTAASDMANVEIWTSNASDFGTSGTQLTALTSDSRAQILLTSDASTVYSIDVNEAGVSDITISSNKIAALNEPGLYAIAVKNCARYVKVQYDSDGTGMKVAQAFVGHDLAQSPWLGARGAYT